MSFEIHSEHAALRGDDKALRAPVTTRAWFLRQVETLYPGCFALVMATGIISNALFLEGQRALSDALFAVNTIAYPWLLLLTILRLILYRRAFWADLTNPRLVFSFFTIVAGSDVFGAGLHLHSFDKLALILWLFALATWLFLVYFSFGVLTFLNAAHGANVVDGGWLIAIVGTESLVILGTIVAPNFGNLANAIFIVIHMLWGIGLGLYGIFITLFAYRIFFFNVAPEDITPLLWVVMGAAAISTNAGSTLILTENGMPFLHSMRPFIDGTTLMVWAWGTWWIPLLVLLGIWKHGVCRIPLSYTPALWSLVFPLGMYALATLRLSLAAEFPPLVLISRSMIWVALGAWAATAIGLAVSSWRSLGGYRYAADLARNA